MPNLAPSHAVHLKFLRSFLRITSSICSLNRLQYQLHLSQSTIHSQGLRRYLLHCARVSILIMKAWQKLFYTCPCSRKHPELDNTFDQLRL